MVLRLKSFRITYYRSILDSGVVNSNDITVLVGPNQSGKSSLLQGLYSLSFHYNYDVYNELTQLENVSKKYIDGDYEPKDLPIVSAVFTLDNEDKMNLKGVIGEIEEENSINEMQITKFIDNSYRVKIGNLEYEFANPLTTIELLRNIIAQLKSLCHQLISSNSTVKDLFDKYNPEKIDYPIDKKSIVSDFQVLDTVTHDPNLANSISPQLTKLKKMLENFPDYSITRIIKFLLTSMPRLVYFKSYDRLDDSVSITELKTNPKAHRTFMNLLQLAEIKISTLEKYKNNTTLLQQYLQQASGLVTKKLQPMWHQETFSCEFRFADDKLMVFTSDPKNPGTLLPPSFGSEGFQWFLGFFINFAVETKGEYKNAILLLDDPGVFLHPSGHKDLLARLWDFLQDNVNTIYSTHLPSLIPKDSITSVRLVYKKDGRSIVTEDFWKLDDRDAWAVIRSSLGIDLADSLFLGPRMLLVEGPSDYIYLTGFNEIFKQSNIDVQLSVFILPMNGKDKLEYFSRLLDGLNVPYVVLLDSDENIKITSNEKLLAIEPVNKMRDKQSVFDIEDLLENELLIEALSHMYALGDSTKDNLRRQLKNSNRKAINIIKEIIMKKESLDKVELAKRIVTLLREKSREFQITLENFKHLFQSIEEKYAKLYGPTPPILED